MSKIMLSAQTRLGGASSKGAIFGNNIAKIPPVVAEHLQNKNCDKLKYVQIESEFYKHVKGLQGKIERFVQKSHIEEIV